MRRKERIGRLIEVHPDLPNDKIFSNLASMITELLAGCFSVFGLVEQTSIVELPRYINEEQKDDLWPRPYLGCRLLTSF
jgi:hypothetical protein